jgi:hypothetical protein
LSAHLNAALLPFFPIGGFSLPRTIQTAASPGHMHLPEGVFE